MKNALVKRTIRVRTKHGLVNQQRMVLANKDQKTSLHQKVREGAADLKGKAVVATKTAASLGLVRMFGGMAISAAGNYAIRGLIALAENKAHVHLSDKAKEHIAGVGGEALGQFGGHIAGVAQDRILGNKKTKWNLGRAAVGSLAGGAASHAIQHVATKRVESLADRAVTRGMNKLGVLSGAHAARADWLRSKIVGAAVGQTVGRASDFASNKLFGAAMTMRTGTNKRRAARRV